MKNIPKELIIKAREGDMDAFREIYRMSSGYVYTIALKITGSREDAEEVTQDVFLSVHRKLGGFRFRSSLKTWIYRIVTNKAINAYRKNARERGKKVPFDDEIAVESGNTEERYALDEEYTRSLVDSMLSILP